LFKNLIPYRLTRFDLSPAELEKALSDKALQPLTGLEIQKSGWVRPKTGDESFLHQSGSHLLFSLGTEKKILPAAVIKNVTNARVREIEAQQGYKVGRKQLRQIKEAVTDELIPRAFSVRSHVSVWIDPVGKWLVIDASGVSKADEVVTVLLNSTDKINFELIHTSVSPSVAMTDWLSGEELPSVFTLDDSCEMRAPSEGVAKIKYSGLAPDADEARKHVESGKMTIQQAMTWDGKISFVLTEALHIKKVKPLDILTEGVDPDMDEFDSHFVLMSGEVPKFLADVVVVLGGLEEAQAA